MSNNEATPNGRKNILAAILKFNTLCASIAKDATNPFFNGSKYASLPTILRAIRMPLQDAGLVIYNEFPDDENVMITVLAHAESGEEIRNRCNLFILKRDVQKWGSAITYQRRYVIAAMLNLSIDEDDDGNASVYGDGNSGTPTRKTREPLPFFTEDRFEAAVSWLKGFTEGKPLRRAEDIGKKYRISDKDLSRLRHHELTEKPVLLPPPQPQLIEKPVEKPAEKPANDRGDAFPNWEDAPSNPPPPKSDSPNIRSVEGKWEAAIKWVREAPSPGETRRKATDILKSYGMSKEDQEYLESQEYKMPEHYAQPEDPKEIPDPKRHPAAVPREAPEDSRRVLTEDLVIWSEITAWLQRNPGAKVEQLDGKYIIGDDDRKKLRMYEAAKDSTGVIPF